MEGFIVILTIAAIGLPILLLVKKQTDDIECNRKNEQIAIAIHLLLFFYVTWTSLALVLANI